MSARRVRWAALVACACVVPAVLGAAGLHAGVSARARADVRGGLLGLDAQGGFVVGGRPTFLVALSNPPPLSGRTPAGLAAPVAIARAGVNLVRVGPTWTGWTQRELAFVLAWQRTAVRLGLRTWVRLNTFAATHSHWLGDAHLGAIVHALTRSRFAAGIGLWQGADEPWSRGIPARSLSFFYCRLTPRGARAACAGEPRLDRHHLLITILAPTGSSTELAPYRRVSDGLGVDVYPVTLGDRHPDLHQVGRWTRTIAGLSRDHFVWTTLQICSTHSYDLRTGAHVLPNATQERYMAYDAIVNGARGLAFFGGHNPHCWGRLDRRYGWNWTFWNSTLAPLIRQIGSRSPLGPALADVASNRVLHTSDRRTEAISRTAGSRLWVIAAHGSGTATRRVEITGLPRSARRATVYGERRSVRVSHGTLTDTYRPWQVHVYRIALARARRA